MTGSFEQVQPAAARLVAGRNLWLAAAIVVVAVSLVVLLAVRVTHALGVKEVTKNPIPTVSVTQVGISGVPTPVHISCPSAARYDTPVGVEGDAGRVAAIYVESGDHVKRGQVLARLS